MDQAGIGELVHQSPVVRFEFLVVGTDDEQVVELLDEFGVAVAVVAGHCLIGLAEVLFEEVEFRERPRWASKRAAAPSSSSFISKSSVISRREGVVTKVPTRGRISMSPRSAVV